MRQVGRPARGLGALLLGMALLGAWVPSARSGDQLGYGDLAPNPDSATWTADNLMGFRIQH